MHFFSTDFPNAGTTLNSSVVLIKENWTGLFPIRGLKYYLPNVGSFLLQAVPHLDLRKEIIVNHILD